MESEQRNTYAMTTHFLFICVIFIFSVQILSAEDSDFLDCENSNIETRGCIITEQREIWADDPFPILSGPQLLQGAGIGDTEQIYAYTFSRTYSFIGGTGYDITHYMQWKRGFDGYTASCYPANYNGTDCHQIRLLPVDPDECPDSALTCKMYVASGIEGKTYAVQYRYDFGILNDEGETFIFNGNDHAYATTTMTLEESTPKIAGRVWRYACTSYSSEAMQSNSSSDSSYIPPSDILGPNSIGCIEAGLANLRVVASPLRGRNRRSRSFRTLTDDNGDYSINGVRNGRYIVRVRGAQGRPKPQSRRVRIRNNQALNTDFEIEISTANIQVRAQEDQFRHRKMYLKNGGKLKICARNLFDNSPIVVDPRWEVGAIRTPQCRSRRFRNSGTTPLRMRIIDDLHHQQDAIIWLMP